MTVLFEPSRWKPWIVPLAIAAAAASNTLVAILLLGQNVPIGDDWMLVEDIRRYFAGTLDTTFLMRQHNEHRIPFPRLYMLLVVQLSDWNLRHLMVSGFGAACLTALLLCRALTRDNQVHGSIIRAHGCCWLAVFVLSIGQHQNWLWGWQVTLHMNVLAVVTGFLLLSGEKLGGGTLIGAGLAGVVGSFSFATGLLFWPISLLLFVGRTRRVHLAFWLALMSSSIAVYLWGYETPPLDLERWRGLASPVVVVGYILTFLGGPLLYLTDGTKLLSGVVGLTLFAFLTRLFLANRSILRVRELQFWLACGAYTLGSGAMVALGRAGLGITQAAESRYLTIANLFWVMLIGGFSWLLVHDRLRPGRWMVFGYRTLCACVALASIVGTVSLYRTWPAGELARVAEELQKCTSDVSLIRRVSRDVPLVERSRPYLKEKGLSYEAR